MSKNRAKQVKAAFADSAKAEKLKSARKSVAKRYSPPFGKSALPAKQKEKT